SEKNAGATGPYSRPSTSLPGPNVDLGPLESGPPTEVPTDPAGQQTPPSDTGPVPGGDVECPAATVEVTNAGELTAALSAAKAGDVIVMADGTYDGNFVARNSGSGSKPIFLCGGRGAVLDAGGPKEGYGFHLDAVTQWRLVGFTITNCQKGLMADQTQKSVIQGLTVNNVGDEGIHLRNNSSDNLVVGNNVSGTGQRKPKFGEGIYIGNAESNWKAEFSRTGGRPDLSDRNVIKNNVISGTTAESVDIKEGTSEGKLIGNRFDGSALGGDKHNDSWVDVKGRNWLIEGNTGVNSFGDGFQTHEIVDGYGTGNVFRNNTADLKGGSGWGFHFAPINGNSVSCNNKVSGAAKGLTNSTCS
ncbi:MAG: right-handed parallel beta-helix repeat-containing protein, partial [Streptosporangiaceae bacterium]